MFFVHYEGSVESWKIIYSVTRMQIHQPPRGQWKCTLWAQSGFVCKNKGHNETKSEQKTDYLKKFKK